MSTSPEILRSFIEIYDIEVLRNCFLYLGIDTKSNQIIEFVIFGARNDLHAFCRHLRSLKGQIGFNNLNYDSQVCQFILNNELTWLELEYSADQITEEIFKFSQETINREGVGFAAFNEAILYCKQLDLYKMHHFDNRAKVQSLKGLQCNLNWISVLESPIDWTDLMTEEKLQSFIDYCRNDILSTQAFYKHEESQKAIELRKGLNKSYDFGNRIMNWSDSKIGSELILKFYCEYTNRNPKEVRKERTYRSEIAIKDCIPPFVKFQTKEFQALLDKFNSTILYAHNDFKFGSANAADNLKKPANKRKEEIVVNYKDNEIFYGIGGAHSSKIGVFESNDEWLIYDIDVASLYPSLAIANNNYIEHLGSEFLEVYKEKIVAVRLREKSKPKHEINNAVVLGLKNAANSVYGKSNDKYSFLFDPAFTFSITLSGQIEISMLAEKICENTKSQIYSLNTDGIVLAVHKSEVERFQSICSEWENLTKLKLEGYCNKDNDQEVIYKKLYAKDVNNYCAVKDSGGKICESCKGYLIDCKKCKAIKLKGCFEKDKLLHKDTSARIVPLALEKYIVHGTKIEDTINNHSIVWDFLLRRKFKKNSSIGEYVYWKDGKLITEPAQKKAERYYIANKSQGKDFTKVYTSGKKEVIEKGWKSNSANLIEDENAFNYPINRRYYIEKCYKIIDSVESNRVQLSLF